MPSLAVAVCTRNRADRLAGTLAALSDQSWTGFDVLVVDQSDAPSLELARPGPPRIEVLPDPGRGLSRARNLAWPRLDADWIVYVDDDCVVERDWAAALRDEIAAHPDADFVSGHVAAGEPPGPGHMPVTTFDVARPCTRRGRWVRPYAIGFGVCMAVRRERIVALGGWDERLGAGVPDLPASEDMDFNYRLLRAGGTAYATPRPRARHEAWRRHDEVVALWHGYMAGWAGFALKHVRRGDPLGGAWLYALGATDTLRVLVGALRRRSRLGLRIAAARTRGLAAGTRVGLARGRW